MIDFPNEESKWAWLAGLVEGEGCISLGYTWGQYKPAFVITNCSLNLLETARSIAGGRIYKRKLKKKHRQCYVLWLPKDKIKPALHCLLPFLETKKEQAKLLIEFLELREKTQRTDEIYQKIRHLNQRGRLPSKSRTMMVLDSLEKPISSEDMSSITGLSRDTVRCCLRELCRANVIGKVSFRGGSYLLGKLTNKTIYFKDGQENHLADYILNTIPQNPTREMKTTLTFFLKQALPPKVFELIHPAISLQGFQNCHGGKTINMANRKEPKPIR